MPILEAVPASFVAGDTVRFTLGFTDYPAPTWDPTFYLENADGRLSKAASDSGVDHAFTLSAAETAALAPGRYKWSIRVTDGSVTETIESGWLEVEIDPANAGND